MIYVTPQLYATLFIQNIIKLLFIQCTYTHG